ncbi:TPA: hypothetical protein I7293_26090 [Vibrio parahaemolyticus]|nr:hypothetical protein [Vibrio parahaemolyticus]HAS6898422.1 hypothetical protein [Vibrio parahaemolyticus]HAS6962178.1 hypothetical protein [Vibrio parahaemolyticus]HAS6962456.1 hypothetical protein [Vibrio parahaemolyticus]
MAKQKFKITNWSTYNKALINRGGDPLDSCICLFPVGRYSTKQQGSSAFPLHNPASGSL